MIPLKDWQRELFGQQRSMMDYICGAIVCLVLVVGMFLTGMHKDEFFTGESADSTAVEGRPIPAEGGSLVKSTGDSLTR